MFYVLVIPSFVLSILMVAYLLSLKKHDRVLYNFCQIRRDAIKLIDERGITGDRVAYHSVRHLLNSLNLMIHNYDGCKQQVFNIRKLVAILKDCKHISRQVEKISIPDDHEVVELHLRFKRSMILAFLAYTPFIRSEVTAFLFYKLFSLLAKSGITSLKKAAEYMGWLVDEIASTQIDHGRKPAII